MPGEVVGKFTAFGVPELELTFASFTEKKFEKQAFDEPSKIALQQTVLPQSKQNARRTHERSRNRGRGITDETYFTRHPNARQRWQGRTEGPMSRFQSVFKLRRGVGSKVDYTSIGSREHLINISKSTGKIFFHPFHQEFGTGNANPPITPKRHMGRATIEKGKSAISVLSRVMSPFLDQAVRNNRFNSRTRSF